MMVCICQNDTHHLQLQPGLFTPNDPSLFPPCFGVTHVYGQIFSVNSYYAELQILHALLLSISYICMHHHIMSGSIPIGCDNQGVLHQVQHPSSYIVPQTKIKNHLSNIWYIFYVGLCRKTNHFQVQHDDPCSCGCHVHQHSALAVPPPTPRNTAIEKFWDYYNAGTLLLTPSAPVLLVAYNWA